MALQATCHCADVDVISSVVNVVGFALARTLAKVTGDVGTDSLVLHDPEVSELLTKYDRILPQFCSVKEERDTWRPLLRERGTETIDIQALRTS